jgi:rubrerythrin
MGRPRDRDTGDRKGAVSVSERLTIVEREGGAARAAHEQATRRDAVRRGALAGAGILAATIPLLLKARGAFAQDEPQQPQQQQQQQQQQPQEQQPVDRGEAPLVEGVIQLELTAQVAYETAGKSDLLKGSVKELANLMARHEKEHADALKLILSDIGGNIPQAPKPEEVSGLDDVKNERTFLEFALEMEDNQVVTYVDLERKASDERLRRLGAQAMANEGEHLVMIREELGRNPIPSAFEGEQA